MFASDALIPKMNTLLMTLMPTSSPPFLRLPDELLLEIACLLHSPGDRADFSLVCRRFRPVGQEVLILDLSFYLQDISLVVAKCLRHPNVASAIKRIQIFTFRREAKVDYWGRWIRQRDIIKRPKTLVPWHLHDEFRRQSVAFVQIQCDISPEEKQEWMEDFYQENPQAYFALLMAMPRDLKHLLIGTSSFNDFPIFESEPGTQCSSFHGFPIVASEAGKQRNRYSYVRKMFDRSVPNLEVLELPLFLDPNLIDPSYPSFERFTKLRKLIGLENIDVAFPGLTPDQREGNLTLPGRLEAVVLVSQFSRRIDIREPILRRVMSGAKCAAYFLHSETYLDVKNCRSWVLHLDSRDLDMVCDQRFWGEWIVPSKRRRRPASLPSYRDYFCVVC
ncbi:hypothetical protein B0J11DRAFT_511538 [Dendryphion nanum]|uniref:F-box domain-containing protein n=1 Tax=Dendryphion nanum TaxID=256645 RepID=A0A9P9IAX9_9PLEO|nr:hypothetical protein B0J11DRAFT_511538 [Dendryphion nanum]